MSGTKKIAVGHYLFREGDPPDAMYVIKTGKFNVVKTKQNAEIILAEIGPGAMVGEMAFFDNKPRSASVKAVKDAEVIALPYKALHVQFSQFPEWSKAIMRTINDHLRNANMRIKALESGNTDDGDLFPPHTTTKLVSILNLVGSRYGVKEGDALVVPPGMLRKYTIQVFGEATHKMQKLMTTLAQLQIMTVDDLGEGNQKISLYKPDLLFGFGEWYNDWLFKKETDRSVISENELKQLNGILHFARKGQKNEKGQVKLNLSEVQNESQKEVGFTIKVEDVSSLIEKQLMTEKTTSSDGHIGTTVQVDEVEVLVPYWQIIYALKKVTR